MATAHDPAAPRATTADAVDEILRISKRTATPLRYDFVQIRDGGVIRPGPIADLVTAGDRRGLLLFLLLMTKASSEPWSSALPAAAWARALDIDLPESRTAAAAVSKIWRRLEEKHHLVRRQRSSRLTDVFLLNESGNGAPYENPGAVGDNYFKIALALWQEGPNPGRRWYQELTLPELAMLVVASSLKNGFILPVERGPEWYGISADTVNRGLIGLIGHEILRVEETYRLAALSPTGYIPERHYTLVPPFKRAPASATAPRRSTGRRSATRTRRPRKASKA